MLAFSKWFQLAVMITRAFVHMLYSPLFWVVVLIVAFQYSRMQKQKEAMFGTVGESVWHHVLVALGSGLLGGLVGSFLMVLVGIRLNDIGILWLLPLAVVLMLISPRLLCFSYAGGLLSLFYLVFGVPRIDVPHLMGLVALLHLVEALLILLSGHLGAIPVYMRKKTGEVVGAFNMQKFWPIPIIGLATFVIPEAQMAGEMINMPDWWPLIKAGGNVDPQNFTYVIIPVMAILGYGDLAAASRPQEKSRRSAVNLFAFSLVLLGLSIAASHYPSLSILPALFSPLGHELVIWLGQKNELKGKSLFIDPQQGVLVLDVLRDSSAWKLGLRSGDTIFSVNGIKINSKYDLSNALEGSWGVIEVEWLPYRANRLFRSTTRQPLYQEFGAILAPGPFDSPMVEFRSTGVLGRWIQRILKR